MVVDNLITQVQVVSISIRPDRFERQRMVPPGRGEALADGHDARVLDGMPRYPKGSWRVSEPGGCEIRSSVAQSPLRLQAVPEPRQ